jgi:Dynamin central region
MLMQCADLVFDEMQRIAAQCETTELSRFPMLRERVVEVVHGEYKWGTTALCKGVMVVCLLACTRPLRRLYLYAI